MADARVSRNGQIVIPSHIRDRYGIRPGTKVCFIEREQEVVFRPFTRDLVRKTCGMLKGRTSATGELLKVRAKDRGRENAKAEHGRT